MEGVRSGRGYRSSLASSFRAPDRTGRSWSARFQRVGKVWYAALALAASPVCVLVQREMECGCSPIVSIARAAAGTKKQRTETATGCKRRLEARGGQDAEIVALHPGAEPGLTTSGSYSKRKGQLGQVGPFREFCTLSGSSSRWARVKTHRLTRTFETLISRRVLKQDFGPHFRPQPGLCRASRKRRFLRPTVTL